MAVLMVSARVRSAVYTRATTFLQREKAREVYRNAYEFTTSMPARRVMDEIAQRWGRTVPDGEPEFYVQSAIEEQQVILAYGNQIRGRIFAARVDFESRDPAAGTLWFFDAEGDDRTEAAE